MHPSSSRCPSRAPTGGPRHASSTRTWRASRAARLGRDPNEHDRSSCTRPVLRVSPHVDTTAEKLETFDEALAEATGGSS